MGVRGLSWAVQGYQDPSTPGEGHESGGGRGFTEPGISGKNHVSFQGGQRSGQQ